MQPKVLIVGSDINAYYMARCYYEIYHQKVDLIGRVAMCFTSLSNITNVTIVPNLIEGDTFVKTLISYSKEHINNNEKTLLIGTNDVYVSLIAQNSEILSKYYIFNYPSKQIMDTLLVKETFYDVYKNSGLDFPNTYIYCCDGSGSIEDLIYKLKDFLESIGYQGFAEFDLKYDIRDKKYKVFEVNPRQSRSGYYLCACGHNLVKLLIDDLFNNSLDNKNFEIVKDEVVLSFVPKKIIKEYVTSNKLKDKIKQINKIVRPLRYKEDMPLRRRKYLFMRDRNYIKKYKKYSF